MANVLIFAYYSFKDPVFQSAVLPYFKNNQKHSYTLLTWEQKAYKLNSEEINHIEETLLANNIIWYRTRWHSGSFKILKKAIDFLWGCSLSLYLTIRYKVDYIYSEGFPGAVIGHYISLITRKKHIIHTFEPHADYMFESKVWTRKSWEYKFLKQQEKKVAKGAFKLITATQSYKDVNIKRGIPANKIIVLPSCVDTNHYRFDAIKRNDLRQKFGIADEIIVISYLGKLGGMYMDEELFQLFHECHSKYPQKFHFMIFNDLDSEIISGYLKKYNIPEEKVIHQYLSKSEVPDYLSAADFGIVAVKPFPSKKYCSPIKNGEYLSCGLPLLTPENIGDDSESVQKNKKLGLLFSEDKDHLPDNIIEFYSGFTRFEIADECRKHAMATRDISFGIEILHKLPLPQ